MPPYFSIPSMSRSGGPNFLGAKYAPFVVPDNPNRRAFRVRDVAPPRGLDDDRVDRRRDLRARVDRFRRFTDKAAGDPAMTLDDYYEQGYDLMSSPDAQRAFDIGRRARHGPRRLRPQRRSASAACWPAAWSRPACRSSPSTRGAGTTISASSRPTSSAWPPSNRRSPTLIMDLDRRGLLETTLVVALGEFGRTPKINKDAGRDHWSNAMSVLFAGGGTPGGQVVGSTDAHGYAANERVLAPENFAATVYTKLGIDPGQDPPHPQRPARPTGERPDPDPGTDGMTRRELVSRPSRGASVSAVVAVGTRRSGPVVGQAADLDGALPARRRSRPDGRGQRPRGRSITGRSRPGSRAGASRSGPRRRRGS